MLVRFLISKDATNLINALKDFIKNCVFFSTIKSDKINLIKKNLSIQIDIQVKAQRLHKVFTRQVMKYFHVFFWQL